MRNYKRDTIQIYNPKHTERPSAWTAKTHALLQEKYSTAMRMLPSAMLGGCESVWAKSLHRMCAATANTGTLAIRRFGSKSATNLYSKASAHCAPAITTYSVALYMRNVLYCCYNQMKGQHYGIR